MDGPGFVPVDFIIFSITIAISIGIGLYYALTGGKQKTIDEYLVGNRRLSVIPVGLSLMVSFESSTTMLGFPAEVYVYGIMYWLYTFGFMVAVLLGAILILPLVHPLKIKSIYEYLELRYRNRTVRLLGTAAGMLYYIFYMGIVLFGPGIALEATTNMPFSASVITVAMAAIIYTSIGGIKAVIWTDVFQCVLMIIGMLSILIQGTILAGGPTKVFQVNTYNNRLNLLNFDPDPTIRHTFWGLVIGSATRLTSLSYNQSTVQRVSSMSTQQEARRVIYISGFVTFITMTLVTIQGLVAYGYYSQIGCDPLTSKQISNPNQILPFMVLDIFRNLPGMAGLFMASLFSASLRYIEACSPNLHSLVETKKGCIVDQHLVMNSAQTGARERLELTMSTLSSGLSSLSAVTVEDFIKPNFKALSDTKLTIIAKLTVPLYGSLAVGISYMIATIPGPIPQISTSILSAFMGPTAGLFLYSIYFPWATTKGAVAGTISSVILSLWLSLGKTFSTSIQKTPWTIMPPVDQCFVVTNTTVANFSMPPGYLPNITAKNMIHLEPQGLDIYYSISYQWIGLLGIIYCIVIAIVTSLIEGLPNSEDIDVRYVLPFFDQFFPFLPTRLRSKLYLGVNFERPEEWLNDLDNVSADCQKELLSPTEKIHINGNNKELLLLVEGCNNDDEFRPENKEAQSNNIEHIN